MLREVRVTEGEYDAVIVGPEGDVKVKFDQPAHPLPVGCVQMMLDEHKDVTIDYIHGEGSVRKLVAENKGTGILVPAMNKSLLFPAVAQGGVLPRKTFSMGEAHETRYYMETRKIL